MTDFKATESQPETNKKIRDDEMIMADIENVETTAEKLNNDEETKKNRSFKFDLKGLIEFNETPTEKVSIITDFCFLIVIGLLGNIPLGITVFAALTVCHLLAFIYYGFEGDRSLKSILRMFLDGGKSLTTKQYVKIKAVVVAKISLFWVYIALVLIGSVLKYIIR